MIIHWCLEAGFASLNSLGHLCSDGPVSLLYKNDFDSVCRCTIDGAWYGWSHEWTPDAKDEL